MPLIVPEEVLIMGFMVERSTIEKSVMSAPVRIHG